tara:strand:- start:1559 stop:2131 length:573 start_codon:yes stop_codon:yes gene_type:complete
MTNIQSADTGQLKETTDMLLRNPDKIADWLTLADKYMRAYVDDPKLFLMPKDHSFLQPLVTAYAKDLDGFTAYIGEIRDAFDRRSAQWLDTQRIYRRVNGRHVQQVRRERSNRAVDKALQLYGDVDFQTRLQWVSNLEHAWAQRRVAFLEIERKRFENDRIDVESRVELLAEFWNDIDTEIHEGKIPKWN